MVIFRQNMQDITFTNEVNFIIDTAIGNVCKKRVINFLVMHIDYCNFHFIYTMDTHQIYTNNKMTYLVWNQNKMMSETVDIF